MTMDSENHGKQQGKAPKEDTCPGKKLDLVTLKTELDKTQGPEYWRSLEELAGSEEFQQMMHREFPKGASEWLDPVSRRGFLGLMSASLALAGMTACTRQPQEYIVPYVKQPEDLILGKPQFFATAMVLGGYASPLLVESHMGRPTKAEGNPEHPASLGASDIFSQASILDMYDPDRAQAPMYLGDGRAWKDLGDAVRGPLLAQKAVNGAGIRLLTPPISSPTLADQIRAFLQAFPQAKWHQYSPLHRDAVLAGAQMAFGQAVETQYKLENADVILSLDADFLAPSFPGSLRMTHDFAARRDPDAAMNRLYVVECSPSPTGVKADHRLPVRAHDVAKFAQALASNSASGLTPSEGRFFKAVTDDLEKHRGSSIVIAGEHQPAEVHALAHAINARLGNVGRTVIYTDPVHASPTDQTASIRDLVHDMRTKKVEMLVILGGNPAYDAPADLNFAGALMDTNIPLRIHHGLYHNETSELCHWHLNEAHYLEAWGDARAIDGTVSIVQPLILPLYEGKSAHELMAILMSQGGATGYDIVRGYWQKQAKTADFESWWRKSVHDGFIAGTAYAPKSVSLKSANFSSPTSGATAGDAPPMEVNFRRDPCVLDGSFANNGWLQELPKPMSKMTWDNPVWIGPAMAQRLGIKTEDVVDLELGGKKLTAPVWIQAGHPDNSITVFLGYGRRRAGRAGTGAGFDVYPLRTSDAPWITSGVKLTRTSETYKLATTQGYQTIETATGNRPIVRATVLEEYKKNPEFAHEMVESASKEFTTTPREFTMYPNVDYADPKVNTLGYAWGMTIDMNSCVGCNACMMACQSENNIAVVGKEQVVVGRHMHWIRVDAYYQGDRNNPTAYFQPVPCMQCENAPCEQVCPVGATVHSTEGLNDMVYNRCVGTRYCSNNCPYKVRRFNFLLYQDWETPQYKMMRNPDVTVRSRGVMEKCTYCVQRINSARIESEKDDRKIRDGEIETACQQACPANAIVFGNVNDPESKVSKLKARARNYGMLAEELNTRPRTTYLAEVRNPNPELAAEPAEHA